MEPGGVGGPGGINRVLADGAGGRVVTAQAVQRLKKDVGRVFALGTLRRDVKFEIVRDAQPGQNGAALLLPCVRADAAARTLGAETREQLPDAGL